MISIITPTFNSSKYIGSTINSILAQTYENWELIIVDDCSTDDTAKIIKNYILQTNKITFVPLSINIGAAEARNIAIRKAKGQYIAFLDSDDIWLPSKLEKQLNFMTTNKYAFTFTDYQLIDEKGNLLHKTINCPKKIDYPRYLKNTIIGCLTVMIDRNIVGSFEMPDIRSSHDMALWLSIMKRGYTAYCLNEVLSQYRIVNNSNTAKKTKAAKDVWRVYREIEHLSIGYSLICFFGYAFNAVKKRIL